MSGYDGPTTDPWDAIKQRQQREHEAAQEANRPGRTQTFQSVRKLWNAILELRVLVDNMTALFNRMPQNDGAQVDTSGWSVDTPPVGGAWTTVASATIQRPENMNRVALMAIGTAASVIDNGGLSGAMQGRIVIAGTASNAIEGSSEYGASQMRSALNMGHFREFAPGASVVVEFQLRGRMSEFPGSNVASLSVSAGFTRVG